MELLVLGVLDSVPARTMEPVMWLMVPAIAQRGTMASAVNNVSSASLHAHVFFCSHDHIPKIFPHQTAIAAQIRNRFDQDIKLDKV